MRVRAANPNLFPLPTRNPSPYPPLPLRQRTPAACELQHSDAPRCHAAQVLDPPLPARLGRLLLAPAPRGVVALGGQVLVERGAEPLLQGRHLLRVRARVRVRVRVIGF